MATHGTNGTNDIKDNNSKYDSQFTQYVINLMSPETKPRYREIFNSLIKHLHDFYRDVEFTQDKWLLGVNYVNAIGQIY
jgi:catechol 1,2-dioxygenase